MKNNNLAKSFPIQLEIDQYKALTILKSKGFNKSKFIRLAVYEKLHRDFRIILKELKELNADPTHPDWA